ncbi:MAG: DUF1460 domain-containing protein [Ignavibacteriales bacterium]|jgi:hypothetical protein|nr:MAG: DUF1460 domain-containing protein [Ignavibacteriales bacterium]
MKFIKTLFLVLLFSPLIYCQENNNQLFCSKDSQIFGEKISLAKKNNLHTKNINEIIESIGKSFIGTNYVANTLENSDTEKPIFCLDALDCYTFVEATLSLSRIIKNNKSSIDDYIAEIENIRYRDGQINGYPSRLHYFSDWIYEMNKRGICEDITKKIGGMIYSNNVDYMSTHPNSYKHLKSNPENVKALAETEKVISQRRYYYIPQERIALLENKIESGDIIGITTNVDGLDIAHTGLAIKMNSGRIHFLHAPNVGFKVEITKKPLSEYVKGNKKQTGIMVVRPINP